MTIRAIDDSQRKAARVFGIAYLVSVANVVFATFGVHQRLIVAGSAADTARNIMEHELLFRISIGCSLIYCVGVVVALTALYVILAPVNRNLALFAAFCVLVYAGAWVLMTLNLLDVLRVLSGADYLRVFEPAQLHALAKRYLGASFDRYYVGLLFWALGATVFSYLWFQSHYIPRALAAFGVISSAWCALCTFVFIIFPAFSKVVNLWWFDTPMALFDIALSFWLLFRGLRSAEKEKAST